MHFEWNRPMQYNGADCGVYVMKYMDVITQNIALEDCGELNAEDAKNFRYRIGHEIRNHVVRKEQVYDFENV